MRDLSELGLQTHISVYYDYFEMVDYVEKKYRVDTRDFAGRFKHGHISMLMASAAYDDETWYYTKPAEFTDTQKAAHDCYVELMKAEPPYQDYWHEICDDIQRGAATYWNFADQYEGMKDRYGEDSWQAQVSKLFVNEFGDDDYTVLFDW